MTELRRSLRTLRTAHLPAEQAFATVVRSVGCRPPPKEEHAPLRDRPALDVRGAVHGGGLRDGRARGRGVSARLRRALGRGHALARPHRRDDRPRPALPLPRATTSASGCCSRPASACSRRPRPARFWSGPLAAAFGIDRAPRPGRGARRGTRTAGRRTSAPTSRWPIPSRPEHRRRAHACGRPASTSRRPARADSRLPHLTEELARVDARPGGGARAGRERDASHSSRSAIPPGPASVLLLGPTGVGKTSDRRGAARGAAGARLRGRARLPARLRRADGLDPGDAAARLASRLQRPRDHDAAARPRSRSRAASCSSTSSRRRTRTCSTCSSGCSTRAG